MRVAFTIVLNGLHHLQHKGFFARMMENFDYWVIVEGMARNTGSTKWCREMPPEYYDDRGLSVDGTTQFLDEMVGQFNETTRCRGMVRRPGYGRVGWLSKDDMVNAALEMLREFLEAEKVEFGITPVYLWQVDVDEQWSEGELSRAEMLLKEKGVKTGMFLCNYFVGRDLLAVGDWGEGLSSPYRRLWQWEGEWFESHEPPVLEGGNGKEELLPCRFDHYAYYFRKDVEFKDKWYGGHQGILKRWDKLQRTPIIQFPLPINELLPEKNPWADSDTWIVHIPSRRKSRSAL